VQQEDLNEALLAGTDEKLSDRFGTGLFYFNSTDGVQVVKKSAQMQLDATTAQLATAQLTPGCSLGCVERRRPPTQIRQ
jgi:hypothetical protein